jgi:protein-S-isoprenylcysteine O-methyltransferase Ste14
MTGILILACWVLLMVYWRLSASSVKPAAERQTWSSRLARSPALLGFLLMIVAGVHPFGMVMIGQSALSASLGVAVCALGLFVSIWSRKTLGSNWSQDVELKHGHELVERGPYRYVRHPIYTGILLMALGTAIASGLLIEFLAFLCILVGFYIKLKQEETLLLTHFPDEYPAYKARVKAIVPFVL